jgi:hypothetical protein
VTDARNALCSAHPEVPEGRDDTPSSADLALLYASGLFAGDNLFFGDGARDGVPAVKVLAAATALW